jgi:hypothetical protein
MASTMIFNWQVSEATRKRNPHLFGLGPVPPSEPKRNRWGKSKAADADKTRSKVGVVVSLIGLRRIPLDDDNFCGACKYLRDAIAESIGLDDGDSRLRWQYQQCQTSGAEGLIVKIEIV